METKMRKSKAKLHTHTHTHICYKQVAEHFCYTKITKNGNIKLNQDITNLAKEVILS